MADKGDKAAEGTVHWQDKPRDKLEMTLSKTSDGQFLAGVSYPDDSFSIETSGPHKTRDQAIVHGTALLIRVQAQEDSLSGRTMHDVDSGGKVFSFIQPIPERPSATEQINQIPVEMWTSRKSPAEATGFQDRLDQIIGKEPVIGHSRVFTFSEGTRDRIEVMAFSRGDEHFASVGYPGKGISVGTVGPYQTEQAAVEAGIKALTGHVADRTRESATKDVDLTSKTPTPTEEWRASHQISGPKNDQAHSAREAAWIGSRSSDSAVTAQRRSNQQVHSHNVSQKASQQR